MILHETPFLSARLTGQLSDDHRHECKSWPYVNNNYI